MQTARRGFEYIREPPPRPAQAVPPPSSRALGFDFARDLPSRQAVASPRRGFDFIQDPPPPPPLQAIAVSMQTAQRKKNRPVGPHFGPKDELSDFRERLNIRTGSTKDPDHLLKLMAREEEIRRTRGPSETSKQYAEEMAKLFLRLKSVIKLWIVRYPMMSNDETFKPLEWIYKLQKMLKGHHRDVDISELQMRMYQQLHDMTKNARLETQDKLEDPTTWVNALMNEFLVFGNEEREKELLETFRKVVKMLIESLERSMP